MTNVQFPAANIKRMLSKMCVYEKDRNGGAYHCSGWGLYRHRGLDGGPGIVVDDRDIVESEIKDVLDQWI